MGFTFFKDWCARHDKPRMTAGLAEGNLHHRCIDRCDRVAATGITGVLCWQKGIRIVSRKVVRAAQPRLISPQVTTAPCEETRKLGARQSSDVYGAGPMGLDIDKSGYFSEGWEDHEAIERIAQSSAEVDEHNVTRSWCNRCVGGASASAVERGC